LSYEETPLNPTIARKVVVIDDEDQVRSLIAEILTPAGYQVVGIGESEAAVDIVRNEAPDLVLCDIAMPRMDGYAVLNALQADPETARYPVVFLTAHAEFTQRVRAFRFGVVDFLPKPFTNAVLLLRIERILETLERRSGRITSLAGQRAVNTLLGEVQKDSRTGVISVQGEAKIVIRAGQVVEDAGSVASGGGTGLGFRELDPSRDYIVAHEATRLPGTTAGIPSLDDVPQLLRSALVVDDNPAFRSSVSELLKDQGFTVYEAGDGEAALAIALERRPWLILTDVSMPGMDGFEFCRRVREHSLIRHTPLVFLSGWDDYKERYAGMALGGDDYLSKQTPVRELLLRIHLILKRYSEAAGRAQTASGMEGRLDLVGASGVLQMCHLGGLSGLLTVRSGTRTLQVRFRDGEIVGADSADAIGTDVLFELLSWTRGSFAFAPGDPGDGVALGETFDAVLLEGCRRLDENRKGGKTGDAPIAVEDRGSDGVRL
jgi:DNA-binding response OmpR family regulator